MMITGEVSAVEASIAREKELVAEKGMYLDSSVIAHPDRTDDRFHPVRAAKEAEENACTGETKQILEKLTGRKAGCSQ